MHDWNDNGWAWGSGLWILMVIMMVLFWGGVAWLIISLIRRPAVHQSAVPPSTPQKTPEEVLHERLARGEIEPDDYQRRLELLERQRKWPFERLRELGSPKGIRTRVSTLRG